MKTILVCLIYIWYLFFWVFLIHATIIRHYEETTLGHCNSLKIHTMKLGHSTTQTLRYSDTQILWSEDASTLWYYDINGTKTKLRCYDNDRLRHSDTTTFRNYGSTRSLRRQDSTLLAKTIRGYKQPTPGYIIRIIHHIHGFHFFHCFVCCKNDH